MTAATIPPEVDSYLSSVREALDDLPTAERDDLLAEVEDSLLEAVTEGGGPITARLGRPEDFAAELRTAAGLHERAPDPQVTSPRVRWRDLVSSVAADGRIRAATKVARELAPVWWVARAYIAVAMAGVIWGAGWSVKHPWVPHLPTAETAIVILGLALVASVWLGLRERNATDRVRRYVLAGNLVLVAAILPVYPHLTADRAVEYLYVTYPADPLPGLVNAGAPVDNIYPYSRDGRLLQDVLLYDAAGAPIALGGGVDDPTRRVLRTPSGEPLLNSFPIRYYEPGTTRVARPNAGPAVSMPRIVTPPLASEKPAKGKPGRR